MEICSCACFLPPGFLNDDMIDTEGLNHTFDRDLCFICYNNLLLWSSLSLLLFFAEIKSSVNNSLSSSGR